MAFKTIELAPTWTRSGRMRSPVSGGQRGVARLPMRLVTQPGIPRSLIVRIGVRAR